METWKSLVASIVATGVKVSSSSCTCYSQLTGIVQIDLNETAKHFDTTYSTLENRFHPIKKDAAAMQGGKAGNGGETTPRNKASPATPRSKTPKKDALHSMFAAYVKAIWLALTSCSQRSRLKERPKEEI